VFSKMRNKSLLFSKELKSHKTFAQAKTHSRHVHLFKVILFVLIAVIVLTSVFSWLTFFPSIGSLDIIPLNSNEDTQDNRFIMTAPKIEGYTSDNTLYSLTAQRAFTDPQRAGIIELEGIRAVLPFGNRGQAVVNGPGGVFENINGRLQLHRPFTVQTPDGTIAYLLSADMNMKTSQLQTREKVEIRSKTELLKANSMRVLDNGHTIIFDGSVKIFCSMMQ